MFEKELKQRCNGITTRHPGCTGKSVKVEIVSQ
jgi:hypothetical protein